MSVSAGLGAGDASKSGDKAGDTALEARWNPVGKQCTR
jgi:hypothetical protein